MSARELLGDHSIVLAPDWAGGGESYSSLAARRGRSGSTLNHSAGVVRVAIAPSDTVPDHPLGSLARLTLEALAALARFGFRGTDDTPHD